MKQYKCLTNDSSLAAAIFVPFYAGFNAAKYFWGYNISVRDAASNDLVEWLQKRDEWKLMNGKDHFLVGGRTTWDFRRSTDEDYNFVNKLLLLPAVKNMSVLFIESSPWNSNEFAITYPSYFHSSKDVQVFHWQDRMRTMEQKWLFCFGGALRPGKPDSIRSLLIGQCKNSGVAKLLDCGVVAKKCHSPSSIMKMFQSLVFCLQPLEQRLSQIDPHKIKMMREEVINLIPGLMYADPRYRLETLKDAFDVSVEAIINKVTKLRHDMMGERMMIPLMNLC
ncbi:xyloglucan galactosyltransferase MUR3 [Tanacetum coccineum]